MEVNFGGRAGLLWGGTEDYVATRGYHTEIGCLAESSSFSSPIYGGPQKNFIRFLAGKTQKLCPESYFGAPTSEFSIFCGWNGREGPLKNSIGIVDKEIETRTTRESSPNPSVEHPQLAKNSKTTILEAEPAASALSGRRTLSGRCIFEAYFPQILPDKVCRKLLGAYLWCGTTGWRESCGRLTGARVNRGRECRNVQMRPQSSKGRESKR